MKQLRHIVPTLLLALLPVAAQADGPFLSLSFAEACKRAEAEKKLVFLDFYTTWCGPCKLMDKKTWKDPKVIEFLRNKVVALAVDADKDVDLAGKFRVNGYPTLLFAKPDGSIVESAVGYLGPDEFLGMSEQVVSGKDSLTRLTEALKKSPDDAVARLQLAEVLAAHGQHKEAMGQLTRLLEGPTVTPVGAGLTPVAVYQLYNLSSYEPEAEKTAQKLYDASSNGITERTASDAQLALYAAVNLVNNEPAKTLAAYDELRRKGGNEGFLERATRLWKSTLINEKRYEDVAQRVDVVAAVKQLFSGVPARPATSAPSQESFPSDTEELSRRQLIMQMLDYYKALVALQRTEQAAEVAQEALRIDGSPMMYEALAWTGFSTGKPLDANLEQARKASELAGGKDVGKIDTLARILHALGKKDEAIKLVKDAQQWAVEGPDRQALEQCLSDIGA